MMNGPTPESKPNTNTAIALVGHCGPDSWMLKSMVQRTLPDATILMINSAAELTEATPTLRVLLINRILDGDFPSESGLDLINSLPKNNQQANPRAILISNFEDAQAEAQAAGAAPGFGKSQLNQPEAAQILRNAFESNN